ncbi:MAG: HD domain-containing protein [Ktedonobacteraceae bacterium]|nr:HD domain-containing protein [Ktedonobacteraceae bacterium]
MPTIYDQIYAAAEPYWQTRSNEIHVPESYALAKALLLRYPEADETVVLPAILLHDIGYMSIPRETQMQGLAGSPLGWDAAITRLHEIEGARLAGEILTSLNYDPAKIALISQIIDGHDSRKEALSLDDAIVKDADKLWRFTLSGVRICHEWTHKTPAAFMAYVESHIADWLLTEQGKGLARVILEQTRQAYATRTEDESTTF